MEVKPNLTLTSETKSAHIWESIPLRIGLSDDSGDEVGATERTIIDLVSDSETGQFALEDNFISTVSSVTIRPGTSFVEVHYRDTEAGEVTITISSEDVEDRTLKLTIDPPDLSIIHEPVEQIEAGEDIVITANIAGDPKPTRLVVAYRKLEEDSFVEVDMESAGGGRWESFLPPGASKKTVGVVYYLRAFTDDFEIDITPPDKTPEQQIYGVSISGLELDHEIPAAAYSIISIPMDPDDADPVSSLQSSIGEQTSTTWRIFGYDPITEAYAENQTLTLSRGYWLLSKEAADLVITGTTAGPLDASVIRISKGWNLIGNPYAFEVFWGNTVIRISGEEYEFNSSEANQYIRQRYWWYDDASPDSINNGIFQSVSGPFDEKQVMQPWNGYAIYALEDCDLVISPSQVGPQMAPSAGRTHALWRVQLVAQAGNMVDSSNYFGVSAASSDGYDVGDSEKPPFPSGEVSVFFPHLDWGKDANRYAEDYRSPYSYEKNWHVAVNSARRGAAVQLQWRNTGDIPPQFNAYLMDMSTEATIDMRRDSGYLYWSEYDGNSRDFQIVITERELQARPAAPVESILLQNYPNPFNPETWIPYYLSESNPVVIQIYSASGQLVRILELGHKHVGYYDAKERAAYWDGLNEDSEQVSSGVYFYKIQAGDYTAIKKMTVAR